MFYLKKCDYPPRISFKYDAAVPEIPNCKIDRLPRKTITGEWHASGRLNAVRETFPWLRDSQDDYFHARSRVASFLPKARESGRRGM